MRRAAPVLAALALAGLGAPAVARAHGVAHEVRRRGDAWAVRARYHGGKPLAGATFQVLRPGDAGAVAREGVTPADGWVEFTPDVPGTWRVRIADRTGHGAVVRVEVTEVAASEPGLAASSARTAAPENPSTTTTTSTSTFTSTSAPAPAPGTGSGGGEPSVGRTALAAVGIAAAFLAAWALRRRRPGP